MNTSNAVSESARSAVVGYKITKGNYAPASPYLPQRIAILSEVNTDKQSGFTFEPFDVISASDVAAKIGAGSPAYLAMRILKPLVGGGLSGIPISVYPVASNSGATATVATITLTGTATGAATHTIVIAGRTGVDGQSYSVPVKKGDTALQVATKIVDKINSVYGTPVIATLGTGAVVTLTSKWKGISSVFELRTELLSNPVGLTYTITKTAGTGAPSLTDALASFESVWNTLVINPYNDTDSLDALEAFNGRPDPENTTGRYSAIVFKPFVAFYSKSSTDPINDLDVSDRLNDCTNVYCPAPNVKLLPVEVAANVCALVANIAQNSPHLDVNDKSYPDAIVDSTGIGNYSDYDYRDAAVKAGISTVEYIGGDLVVKDLVTTYHPTNEVTPQFAYVRNLLLDWNIRYMYKVLEQSFVVNKALVPDGTVATVDDTISPAQWKAILSNSLFKPAEKMGLIADKDFSIESLKVQISSTNPDRFETFFRYKRTGIARICSTTAEAGFYYGS